MSLLSRLAKDLKILVYCYQTRVEQDFVMIVTRCLVGLNDCCPAAKQPTTFVICLQASTGQVPSARNSTEELKIPIGIVTIEVGQK